MKIDQVESLARATLAHGFIQVVIHFPQLLEEIGIGAEETLQQALRLAEEAIALAPELPDGHTALGRLLLCHDSEEAAEDALEVLRHALSLDCDHDPAEVALATAMWIRGEAQTALEATDRVLKRGNAMPQALMLRGLLHQEAGRLVEARRDFERAANLAPQAPLFRLDAAAAAEAAGDEAAARAHREVARELLGEVFQQVSRAREGPVGTTREGSGG